jgi:hypothetical protein
MREEKKQQAKRHKELINRDLINFCFSFVSLREIEFISYFSLHRTQQALISLFIRLSCLKKVKNISLSSMKVSKCPIREFLQRPQKQTEQAKSKQQRGERDGANNMLRV